LWFHPSWDHEKGMLMLVLFNLQELWAIRFPASGICYSSRKWTKIKVLVILKYFQPNEKLQLPSTVLVLVTLLKSFLLLSFSVRNLILASTWPTPPNHSTPEKLVWINRCEEPKPRSCVIDTSAYRGGEQLN
jgi:hypothetical protein